MLGQTPPIFDGTIKDNLLMGLRLSEKPFPNDAALRSALTTVSLEKFRRQRRFIIRWRKQRLAFARIVLMDPPVYLLDEPTSALDSDTERRVMKQFTMLAKEKKTVIFITHSQQLPEEIADDIIEISKANGATRKEVLSVEGRD